MIRGEKSKLHKFFHKKVVTITVVNSIDKRMDKFFASKWNYTPRPSSKKWIAENYIPDSKIIKALGWVLWRTLTVEERIELKAEFIIRQWVWKTFHLWNRQFTKQWMIKYSPETDFKVEITSKDDQRAVSDSESKE